MKSAERRNTFKDYFKARCFRILPQLWMVVLLSVLVVGPLFTTLSVGQYFRSPDTYKYLLNGVFILVHELPGVFTDNVYGSTVNGPLWTLPVEFICYILCFIYFKLKLAEEKRTIIALPVIVCGVVGGWFILSGSPTLQSIIRPMLFFYIGMVYYILRDRIPVRFSIAVIALILMIVSLVFGVYFAMIYLTLPYMLIYVGYGLPISTDKWMRKYEVSYGAYLTAWPLQQMLVSIFPEISHMLNFVLASVGAVLLGYLGNMADKGLRNRLKS